MCTLPLSPQQQPLFIDLPIRQGKTLDKDEKVTNSNWMCHHQRKTMAKMLN